MRALRLLAFMVGLLSLYYTISTVEAQTIAPATTRALVQGPVDDSSRVTLPGNVRPEARPQFDRGQVADDLPLQHMWLQLKRSPEQQAALDALVEQLHTPGNPNFHQWLTPAEFGQTFGVAPSDIAKVTGWLQSHGMTVNHVYTNGTLIDFSGTAGTVREAFHTAIHNIVDAQGEKHIVNMTDPSVPSALAPVITGVVRLHDYAPKPMSVATGQVSRKANATKWDRVALPSTGGNAGTGNGGVKSDFSTICPASICTYAQTLNIVAPADFATIYNETPLLTASTPITGKGQTLVMLEDSDMQAADFTTFRSEFLPSGYTGTLQITHPAGANNCADPGKSPDEVEAAIDAEWAGVVAPNATVVSASCQSTSVAFGGLIALENMLNSQTTPAIYNLSFGECETSLGYAQSSAFEAAYQQAAAQGASVFVASGNVGGASCDGDGASYAVSGLSVNGYASTPYNVAVGGTDFSDSYAGTTSTYWSTTNGATFGSAKSYIPEVPWDDSCANALNYGYQGYSTGENFCNSAGGERSFLNTAASGGGASLFYTKPSFQAGFAGIVNDSSRDLPDISLFSSGGIWGHSSVYCMSDASEGGTQCGTNETNEILANIGGGTAFASAAMAGVQALINQKAGEAQGNPNYVLYGLAKAAYGTGGSSACNASSGTAESTSCVFHDVTQGDNSVPCLYGSTNCMTASSEHSYGVLSADGTNPAYKATTGYDMATGIGTPNIANLVNGWAAASAGAPTMTVVVNPGSVLQGKTIVITATVSGQGSYPTGTIQLTGSGAAGTLGSVTLPIVPTSAPACASTCQNSVSFSYTLPKTLALGTYTVTAAFTSAGEQYKSTTATTQFYIASKTTTTTLGSMGYNGGGAAPVAVSINWTGGTTLPTGNVVITAKDNITGSLLQIGSYPLTFGCEQSAAQTLSCSFSYQPPLGSYTATAAYSGDANYAGSTSNTTAINDVEASSTPTLAISPSTITPGNPTPVFTVVLVGTLITQYEYPESPTGLVTLSGDNGLGTFASIPTTACKPYVVSPSGQQPPAIQCTIPYKNMWFDWGNTTYHITATFHGSGYFADSVATSTAQTLIITGGAASTTSLTLTGNGNYVVGSSITATLVSTGISGKGRPTGLVNLTPTGLGFPVSFSLPTGCTLTNSYTTTCTYTFTIPANAQPGPYSMVASYVGDANYNPSSATVPLFVLPSISFTSTAHNFGSVTIGQSLTYTLNATNNMSTAFPFVVGIQGNAAFTMQTNCPASLPAGKSCTLAFTYKPTATGTQTATWAVGGGANITFYPSDGGTLTGTGIAAAGVTLTSAGFNFGPQAIGSISQVYGTVLTNGTADPLTVSVANSGNTADFHTYAMNCPATLAAGASCNLQYQFTPQTTGPLQQTVSLTLVDTVTSKPVAITSGGSTVTGIALSGTGQ